MFKQRLGKSPWGVDLCVICEHVPVVSLDEQSVFHDYASWMIQVALENDRKADALYEPCFDQEIIKDCRRWGFNLKGIRIARLRHKDLNHVKAVGTTGKRSLMLALVVALVWSQEEKLRNLWKELRGHRLEDAFRDVLESAKVDRYETSSNVAKGRTGTAENMDLHFVCDRVPLLSLNKPSVFF